MHDKYMCIYIYIYMYIRTYMYTYVRICIHMYVCMVCASKRVHYVFVCMYLSDARLSNCSVASDNILLEKKCKKLREHEKIASK